MSANVIDSSGWLEFFTRGPNGPAFRKIVAGSETLVVPSITIYEVTKILLMKFDARSAARAVALMERGDVVALDSALAREAANLSLRERLPMANSIILATARRFDAVLWTQDVDFAGIDGVRYLPKPV